VTAHSTLFFYKNMSNESVKWGGHYTKLQNCYKLNNAVKFIVSILCIVCISKLLTYIQ